MKWLVVCLLILAFGLVFNMGLLAYAMYSLLAVMLLSRYLSRGWVQSVTAERECNRLEAEVGDQIAVVVQFSNSGNLPVPWVLVEDLLPRRALMFDPPSLEVSGQRLQLAMLWRGAKRRMMYQMKCHRRGYYQIGPVVLETGDLFGLHRRYRAATEPHYLMVYPRVIPLEGYDIASRRPIGEVRMSYRLYEDPTRIAGVRQYQAGDPLNRVHWRATARTGELHSKVYEPSTVAGATLLLDFHSDSFRRGDEPLRSELAVTAAASVANAVYEMGQQVGLMTNGRDAADRVRQEGWQGDLRTRQVAQRHAAMQEKNTRLQPVIVDTRRGAEQFRRILVSLARLELTDGLTLPQVIVESAARLPRDATVIVLLAKVTDETAIALDSLKHQGLAVAAIINTYERVDFARASGPLLAHGISTYHLKDESAIPRICRTVHA